MTVPFLRSYDRRIRTVVRGKEIWSKSLMIVVAPHVAVNIDYLTTDANGHRQQTWRKAIREQLKGA